MSKAGIQSNRGDGYQTLVAFEWALDVLSDPAYEWLEVDAATIPVDDVVVGKKDGSRICCQCKKNQTSHQSWSITDLADELQKASELLASDPKASVRFYSRSPFGELATLREYSTNYPNAASYQANLSKTTETTNAKLKTQLEHRAPTLSTHDFLRRTTFEISPELDRMETLLRERLHRLASNPDVAFNALWTRLDLLGMRADSGNGQKAAIQHRLSKADLQSILDAAGSLLVPTMNLVEVRSTFESTSAVGRKWRRDIAGEVILTPLVAEILTAIDSKPSSILLTGQPGSGKTCVMLALQEALELQTQSRLDRFPLFIQSREFADLDTAQDRQAQGLPHDWVERAARMAETAHVVVIIDSLDVLSIAREHKVLDYFLAQIDRLLRLPNVTVITACRDFDRQYDRRIAQRKWSSEFKCAPLNWATDIAPLLTRQGIDTSDMEDATRQLIQNPRELALYVELARQGGSFNVVTSQALAQKYLDTIVQGNNALGSAAMHAIEAISTEMLKLRSLSVPPQRLASSDAVRRSLLSHNVLQQTQDGKLTFGHQTLLDVLVISDALRQGKTLHAFVQNLPPVPFVRPSIRSFVAQLATGDRKIFRSQLRTVLTHKHVFHIRRLVAECLAEQIPQDDDWPLIRDLRAQHPEVFQVVYTQAVRLEWHHFWMKHLVPHLKLLRDGEGMTRHFHRISAWKTDDVTGVIGFWTEVLTTEWVDRAHLGEQLAFAISSMGDSYASQLSPLLKILLNMPRGERSFLGKALARCVTAGGLDDEVLWKYIAGEVSDKDVLGYRFDKNLHCEPNEFGHANDRFLTRRMQMSTSLLNLAVDALEGWSKTHSSRYGGDQGYRSGFLRETSYEDTHSQTDHRPIDSGRIFMDSIEAAVVHHANTNSEWWQLNRKRLCSNTEGALRYFAIRACIATPATNLEVIGRMLCDADLLKSDLSFEIGALIQTAFIDLDFATQDAIQLEILDIYREDTTDTDHLAWRLLLQAQLILPIPCHLRTPASQAVIDKVEYLKWPLVRQASIDSAGGWVAPPFSFEVFLNSSDVAVLGLLRHYEGYLRNSFSDFLIGGEEEVGRQLQEATSRHPGRFIAFLLHHWEDIPKRFRDDLMDGAATHLAIRHGNLQPNGNWTPVKEADAAALAQDMLNALEKYPEHWHHSREAAKALEACAHLIHDTPTSQRLVLLARQFLAMTEKESISGDSVSWLDIGINMTKGNVADALMIVATELQENSTPWPELLAPTLRSFANDIHPAVRAVMLRRLPYLQSLNPEFGWHLFDIAMHQPAAGLWAMAEPCLYYAYHQRFEIVKPRLVQMATKGDGKDLETWGRIAALAALSDRFDFNLLLEQLKTMNTAEAWRGAASIWSHPENYQRHIKQCYEGLEVGMSLQNQHAAAVARKLRNLFWDPKPLAVISLSLLKRCFELLKAETEPNRREFHGFDAWLNAMSQHEPEEALAACEFFLEFVQHTRLHLYDHENNFTQLLTHLFAHAEEREESDSGSMIQRVVAIQDKLLALGVNGVSEWLKAAERQ
ncbi:MULTISPECIES: ATP-binding protein [unclassified Polaromonas]|uniref:AAA family ATPase n=1 Tax=unclassified Polaromonas TaxID=2638319 RepID=UPI000F07378A|nr:MULTISPECIES: ATP-binding protein [unclassified Polaromonas]AYQ29821.1 ATP-binding protein [Polaromonas sp. SP1]QGJ19062.1 AAA family ATPase [Polaromonas sp. Pch-P]